jgi:hypothetical protein
MKKSLIVALAVLTAVPSFAQRKKAPAKFSPSCAVRAGFGYAFPIAGGDAMSYEDHLQPISGTQSYDGVYNTYSLKKSSFATGFSAVIAPCLMLTDHFGIEVGVGLGISMKKYTLNYTSTNPAGSFTEGFTSYVKSPVTVMPAIVVSSGNTRLSAYARAGLALPVSAKIVTEGHYSDNTNGTQTSIFELKNAVSIGACGAAGARYKMNKFMGLWLEVNGMAASLKPKTGQYTSIVQNGQQALPYFNVSDVHYEYQSSYSEKDNKNTSEPTRSTAFSAPFSNIGVSIGVSVGL